MGGGGVKGDTSRAASPDYGIWVARDEVCFHDFQATIMHLPGPEHGQITCRHIGRDSLHEDVAKNVIP